MADFKIDISQKTLDELSNFEHVICQCYLRDFWDIINKKLPKDLSSAIIEALHEAYIKEEIT